MSAASPDNEDADAGYALKDLYALAERRRREVAAVHWREVRGWQSHSAPFQPYDGRAEASTGSGETFGGGFTRALGGDPDLWAVGRSLV